MVLRQNEALPSPPPQSEQLGQRACLACARTPCIMGGWQQLGQCLGHVAHAPEAHNHQLFLTQQMPCVQQTQRLGLETAVLCFSFTSR